MTKIRTENIYKHKENGHLFMSWDVHPTLDLVHATKLSDFMDDQTYSKQEFKKSFTRTKYVHSYEWQGYLYTHMASKDVVKAVNLFYDHRDKGWFVKYTLVEHPDHVVKVRLHYFLLDFVKEERAIPG